jgi:antitoxin (DNA-binding transcriptional repressor) of toxin-antitoxin stability system
MEEIAISKFKATCLAVLEKVKKTGQPILVTRFGQPIAQITPPGVAKRAPKFGTGADTAEILGDIVGPITDISDWDAWSNPDKDS